MWRYFRNKSVKIGLTTFISIIVAGCGTSPSSGSQKTSSSVLQAKTTQGTSVFLDFSSQPPIARKHVKVDLKVNDPNSKFSKVWISESMPSMSMPKMQTTLTPLSSNQYSGNIMFVMGGKWKLTVHMEDGSTQQIAYFTFQVKQ